MASMSSEVDTRMDTATSLENINDQDYITRDKRQQSIKMIFIIEIVIMLYAFGKTLVGLATSQFVDFIIKEQFAYNDSKTRNISICMANVSDPDFIKETQIQTETSRIITLLSLCTNVPTIFTTFFFGSYSDQIGRKFLFLLPVCGCVIQSTIYALVSYLNASLVYLYIAETVSGCTGGIVTFLIACFAFISDVTETDKNRSFHLAFVDCIAVTAVGVAILGLGYLIKYSGYTIPFITSAVLCVVGSIVIVCFVRDANRDPQSMQTMVPKLRELIRNVIKFYVSDNYGTRHIFLTVFAAHTLYLLSCNMVSAVATIYLLGRPMCMDSVGIGLFSSLQLIIPAIISAMFIKVGQRWFSDVQIAVVGAISSMSQTILVGLAKTEELLYFAIFLASLSLCTGGMMRATLSKLVPLGQHGALFASMSCMEAFIITVSFSMSNGIYQATIDDFSSMVFLIAAGLISITIILLLVLHFVMKKQKNQELLIKDESKSINSYNNQSPLMG